MDRAAAAGKVGEVASFAPPVEARGMKRHHSTFRRQWGWPIGLGALTLFGLLSALLGGGDPWWWMSWAALALPLLEIARHVLFPAKSGGPRHARRREP